MMKKIIFSALLLLTFISVQTVSAKDRSSGAMGSLMDSNAPSGSMSDEDMKKLGDAHHKLYVELIVSVYYKGLLKTATSAEEDPRILTEKYNLGAEIFGLCALIAATEAYDYKSPILENHFVYFTRAFARVVGDPELEVKAVEQRKKHYEVALAKMKKELAGVSPEQKARHKEWKKSCSIALKHAGELNNTSKRKAHEIMFPQ